MDVFMCPTFIILIVKISEIKFISPIFEFVSGIDNRDSGYNFNLLILPRECRFLLSNRL